MRRLLFIGFLLISTYAFSEQNELTQEFDHFDFSLLNNGLFIIPPLIWNIAFIDKTPDYYSSGSAPSILLTTENILRVSTFLLPFFIPIETNHEPFYPGLAVYSIGMSVYFSSWLLLMYFPNLELSSNKFIRLLPAITPFIWLLGIGLMSQTPITYSILSTSFVTSHVGEYLYRFNIITIRY